MSSLHQRLMVTFVLVISLSLLVACQSANEPPTVQPPVAATVAAVEVANTPVPTVMPTEAAAVAEPATTVVANDEQSSNETTAPEPELADVFTILTRAEGLEELATVAEQVGLAALLQGADPLTVLVPPTTAFAELPAAVRADAALMGEILRAHIIEGKFLLEEMAAPATVSNLNGDELFVLVGSTGGTILGSNLLGGDFEAKNGMIHVLDTVIIPQAIEAAVLAQYESVVGEQLQPMQGNIHIANNETSPIAYRSTPPTSGPHYPNIVAWQVYEEPFRYEQLIHNLEDGGIVIYYQCADGCPDLVAQLREVTQSYIDGARHVAVVPNDPTWTLPDGSQLHKDMGAPLILTAWRRSLSLDAFDGDKIDAFIDAFEGIDHHVR